MLMSVATNKKHNTLKETTNKQWAKDFETKNGRPAKILHFGNIANNAYNNAKLQRANGIEADVVAPDYYHIMGCPEWEDAEITGEIEDAFYPDFWSVGLNGFERPDWFVQGPAHLCKSYLLHKNTNNDKAQQLYWRYLQAYRYSLVKPNIRKLVLSSEITRTNFKRLALYVERLANNILNVGKVTLTETFKTDIESEKLLQQVHNSAIENPAINSLDIEAFSKLHDIRDDDYKAFISTAELWMPIFNQYDLVISYSTDPIWPFLGQYNNYIAYEHGTIREIPFQDDQIGRLSKRAYLAAPAVFITNVDNIKAADRMGLTEEQRYYLPHAFDCRKLLDYAKKCDIKFNPDGPTQIFMPSRQHWVDGDPNWAKGNDNVIRATKILKDQGYKPQVVFIEWGNDVDASKELIKELDVEDLINWSPMLNKQQLWEMYIQSTAVIDQFLLPGISGVSFEAMTLGIPVITHDEGDLNERFFGKAPPLLAASNPEQVATQIKKLIVEKKMRSKVGNKSAKWILDYHAPERIFNIQIDAFKKVLTEEGSSTKAKI